MRLSFVHDMAKRLLVIACLSTHGHTLHPMCAGNRGGNGVTSRTSQHTVKEVAPPSDIGGDNGVTLSTPQHTVKEVAPPTDIGGDNGVTLSTPQHTVKEVAPPTDIGGDNGVTLSTAQLTVTEVAPRNDIRGDIRGDRGDDDDDDLDDYDEPWYVVKEDDWDSPYNYGESGIKLKAFKRPRMSFKEAKKLCRRHHAKMFSVEGVIKNGRLHSLFPIRAWGGPFGHRACPIWDDFANAVGDDCNSREDYVICMRPKD
ncbi:hypothetical protein Q1695_010794 [Nippostrongylus brasiliensis]|nr:hypothetical protein Q1695_010794 [Nippostrongylus brasiliensis]